MSPPKKTIEQQLTQLWESGKFEPVIRYIRFPYFRNLTENLRIDFDYPITVLVGPNGTNKSSILRALQGCPDYENIGRFWFGTPLDEFSPVDRHRFIHGRWSSSANEIVEVQKTRIRRRGRTSASDPDYFEPTRPIAQDGMAPMPRLDGDPPDDRTTTRWKAIDKEVVYLDFRAEIAAFDKYFYHNDYSRRRSDVSARNRDGLAARKELIRERSSRVKKILDESLRSYKPGGRQWVVEPPEHLSDGAREAVGRILGRSYKDIEIVTHRAFDVSGTTARLHTDNLNYSEAWAGSGEFAVVQIVHKVEKAPHYSLVLLDEPEVSLHPGAQLRLMRHLKFACRQQKLQIVMATHSANLVLELPPKAIKVLDRNPVSGKIEIRSQSSTPQEAFVAIEQSFSRSTVVVEDSLSAEIVKRALRGAGGSLVKAVDVRSTPGGANSIRTRTIPSLWAQQRTDTIVFLDGDQEPEGGLVDPSLVGPGNLREEVARVLNSQDLDKYISADSGGITEEQLRGCLVWSARYLKFLPGKSPEQWLAGSTRSARTAKLAKKFWEAKALQSLDKADGESVTAEEILGEQKRALVDMDPDSNSDLQAIREAIKSFVSGLA